MKKLKSHNLLTSICCFIIFALFGLLNFQPFLLNATAATLTLNTNQFYFIRNQKSNLYMDIAEADYDSGARLIQYTYTGNANQQFKLEARSDGTYAIIPFINLQMSLAVSGGQNANNVAILTNEKNTTSLSQQFKIEDDGNNTGSYKILTKSSNFSKALTVQNSSTSSANLVQYTYSNNGTSDSDHWYFEPVPYGAVPIAQVRIFAYDGSDTANSSNLSNTVQTYSSQERQRQDELFFYYCENDYKEACLVAEDIATNNLVSPNNSSSTLGHAFIVVKNLSSDNITVGLMSIAPNQCVSIGTFPDDSNFGSNSSYDRGIWYNREIVSCNGGKYGNATSVATYLIQSELSNLTNFLKTSNNDDWSLLNNCSRFAARAWNVVGEFELSAGWPCTPSYLVGNIQQHSGFKTKDPLGSYYGSRAYVKNGALIYE